MKPFADTLKDLAESSSLHGIPKIVSSRQVTVKLLWCLLFVGTFGVFSMQIFNLFRTFYSYPIQTSVSIEYSPLSFPAITFCNMNPIKRSTIETAPTLKDIIYSKAPTASEPGTTARRKRRAAYDKNINTSSKTTTSITATPSSSTSTLASTSKSKNTKTETVSTTTSTAASGTTSSSSTNTAGGDDKKTSGGVKGNSSGDDYTYDYWGSGTGDGKKYSTYGGSGDNTDKLYNNKSFYDYLYSESDYGGIGQFNDYYANYFWEMLTSPRDRWDERVNHFQLKFKNIDLTTRELMGHTAEDMVVTATFASTLQNVSHFQTFSIPEYGNCFTMDSPKYRAWRSGPDYGIKLTFNLEIDEYIKNFASGYGIRMVFHESGTFPMPADEGMTLSPGFETSIGLRLVRVSRLGEPYGKCTDGKDFKLKYNLTYSISACMNFCRVRIVIEQCGCMPADSPDVYMNTTGIPVCDNTIFENRLCTFGVNIKFDQGVWSCACESPCRETVYEKTMSGRRWPNDDYLKNVLMDDVCKKNNTSMEEACSTLDGDTFKTDIYRDNFVRVLIYFEDLNHELITQTPLYEDVRFLSDIGGAMGLFMGASVLSFVEVLQLLLEICLFLFNRLYVNRGRHLSAVSDHVQNFSTEKN